MVGRSATFKNLSGPRTVLIHRNTGHASNSGGTIPRSYSASLGGFLNVPEQRLGPATVTVATAGPSQPPRGVRYMVKGRAPPVAQVARRQAVPAVTVGRPGGVPVPRRRPPPPPPPPPPPQQPVAGGLTLRRAADGRLVLSLDGAGDGTQELVLQVPEGVSGEHLILQDSTGGEVVLQMPEAASASQQLGLQGRDGGHVVVQGDQGGEVVLQGDESAPVVVQGSESGHVVLEGRVNGQVVLDSSQSGQVQVLQADQSGHVVIQDSQNGQFQVLQGGESGQAVLQDHQSGDAVLRGSQGGGAPVQESTTGEGVALQLTAGDPAAGDGQLVMEQHQPLVLNGGVTGEVVLQVPEGSAGQEFVLEQQDGRQVVLQLPQGVAGPDGLVRLIQVTAEDGTIQYIANPTAEHGYTMREPSSSGQQLSDSGRLPVPGSDIAVQAGHGQENPTPQGSAEAAPEDDGQERTDVHVTLGATSAATSDVTSAAEAGRDVPSGEIVVKSEGAAVCRPPLPVLDSGPVALTVASDAVPTKHTDTTVQGQEQPLNSHPEPDPEEVTIAKSEPGIEMVTAVKTEPVAAVTSAPAAGDTPQLDVSATGDTAGSVEEAMMRLMGDEGENGTEQVPPQTAEATPPPASRIPPDRPPPAEPPPADEAPRGTAPVTATARHTSSGHSPAAVCAVCGEVPRAAPLLSLTSAVVRGSEASLVQALSQCLGRRWEGTTGQVVCVACTVLVTQAYAPGPLRPSARDHLRIIWALRRGEAVPENSSDTTPAQSPPKRAYSKSRRGRGRHKRGQTTAGRTERKSSDGASAATDGLGQTPLKRSRRTPEPEHAGREGGGLTEGKNANGESEGKSAGEREEEAEQRRRPSDGGGEVGDDGGSNRNARLDADVVGDGGPDGGSPDRDHQEQEVVVKQEPPDDRPVRVTTSGRRCRAPRAWSPDEDLTPRLKPGSEGPVRGRKRARDSTEATSAVKRPRRPKPADTAREMGLLSPETARKVIDTSLALAQKLEAVAKLKGEKIAAEDQEGASETGQLILIAPSGEENNYMIGTAENEERNAVNDQQEQNHPVDGKRRKDLPAEREESKDAAESGKEKDAATAGRTENDTAQGAGQSEEKDPVGAADDAQTVENAGEQRETPGDQSNAAEIEHELTEEVTCEEQATREKAFETGCVTAAVEQKGAEKHSASEETDKDDNALTSIATSAAPSEPPKKKTSQKTKSLNKLSSVRNDKTTQQERKKAVLQRKRPWQGRQAAAVRKGAAAAKQQTVAVKKQVATVKKQVAAAKKQVAAVKKRAVAVTRQAVAGRGGGGAQLKRTTRQAATRTAGRGRQPRSTR